MSVDGVKYFRRDHMSLSSRIPSTESSGGHKFCVYITGYCYVMLLRSRVLYGRILGEFSVYSIQGVDQFADMSAGKYCFFYLTPFQILRIVITGGWQAQRRLNKMITTESLNVEYSLGTCTSSGIVLAMLY